MRILIVSQYFYPENFRVNDIVQELVKRGHKITVLTGLPNYPIGTIPVEYKNWKKRNEVIFGARVLRCPMVGRKQGALCLGLNYISFSLGAALHFYRKLRNRHFDIIYNFQPSPVFSTFPAWIAKKYTKAPIFLYCMDLWPEVLKVYHIEEQNLLFRFIRKVSRYLYSRCDSIAVTSPGFVKYLVNYHRIDKSKVFYMPQYAESIDAYQLKSAQRNNCIDFMFCGNIGTVQNLEIIVEAVRLIQEADLRDGSYREYKIHFVGDGSAADTLKALVGQYHLEELICFHGLQRQEDMAYYYDLADVLLITLKDEEGSIIGQTVPGKFQTYLAAEKPVIGAIGTPTREMIIESGCGYVTTPNNYEEVAVFMLKFIREDGLKDFEISQLGKNAGEYFEKHFSREVFFRQLEIYFQKLNNI